MAICAGNIGDPGSVQSPCDNPCSDDADMRQACVPSFRDAVLRQKPMLLDTLLTKAVGSESGFDKVRDRSCLDLMIRAYGEYSILRLALLYFLCRSTLLSLRPFPCS